MISADSIRGYIDILILSQLVEEPSYAYAMVSTIAQVSGGLYTIKQTTLYSALKRLEAASLVEPFAQDSESGKTRTYYRITAVGRSALAQKCAEWQQTKAVVDRFAEGLC
ncbi:PadR family transcriptional regulator [Actinomyces minihominis]|uniref:PadR family transcriptional regulator n=1 Tax=Actinomyces minihominis TaxID=2002838 RepID=UPI000C089443|nr:PadR family transcriptional regulator [Actinomyces minihominis]